MKFSKVIAASVVLASLSVAPARAEFAGQGTFGGTSAGTANAQTISIPNLAKMSQLRGVTISWVVGSGLTDTGAATVNVNGLGAVAVDRMNSGGLVALAGGEMPAGKMVQATYDGTELILLTNYASGVPTGQVAYFDASSCPSGWSAANGSGGTVNVVGQFIRSLNAGGSGVDPGRTLASIEAQGVQALTATTTFTASTGGKMVVGSGYSETSGSGPTVPDSAYEYDSGDTTHWTTVINGTGTETRPQNVALLACQKN